MEGLILCLKDFKKGEYPDRSWDRVVRASRGREVSEGWISGGGAFSTLEWGADERALDTCWVWREDRPLRYSGRRGE